MKNEGYNILKCKKLKCRKIFTSNETVRLLQKKRLSYYSSQITRPSCPYCGGSFSVIETVYTNVPYEKKCISCSKSFLTFKKYVQKCMACKSFNPTSKNEFWTYPEYKEHISDLNILYNLKEKNGRQKI